MDQQTLNKLKELKQLLDAGILTHEEMLSEKAKILGTQQEQPVESAPVVDNQPTENESSDIAEDAVPLMTDSSGRIVFEEPEVGKESPVPTPGNKPGISTKTILIVLCVITVLIWGVLLSKKSNSEPTYYSEPEEMVATEQYDEGTLDSLRLLREDAASQDEDNDDEFAFDPWIGSMRLDGGMYITCDSRCCLNFKKVSKGEYTGTIVVMLGSTWPDNDERFDPSYGYLEGTVRAKSDGNVLTVVMDRYTSRAYNPNSDDTNYFENTNISGQIFRITYNGGSYSAVTVGDMEGYIDGIEVKK